MGEGLWARGAVGARRCGDWQAVERDGLWVRGGGCREGLWRDGLWREAVEREGWQTGCGLRGRMFTYVEEDGCGEKHDV